MIEVAPGIYSESIDLKGKPVIIRATGTRDDTFLDGTDVSTSVVRAVGGETALTVLDGFTIRNGSTGSARGDLRLGGGMYIENASPTIRNCTFVSNAAGYGGGLYGLYSSALVENCTFSQNVALEDGGGLQFFGGTPVIRNCIITDNQCGHRGGGTHLVQHVSGGFSALDGCTITGNRAVSGDGGGVSLAPDATLPTKPKVMHCTIARNSSQGRGGGVFASIAGNAVGANVSLTDNTICGNASSDASRTNVWALFDDGGNTICDCIADVDGNGMADMADVGLTLLCFGGETDPEFIQPDQDMNGFIDTGDVAMLLLDFGPCN